MKHLYRRVDARIRTLSRGKFAVLAGILTGIAFLAFTLLLGDLMPIQAVSMSVTIAVVYYILDPNS
ncbi:hypothetical protein Har1130_19430 [Haloarcula sp. CBA1130]|nr:hypothetical protein Har1130_19430 [Haloarcula sp. CBA1130]KAA9397490.1 hypothetical protein Har1129_04190 [Haloarcula sp. CBA1129]